MPYSIVVNLPAGTINNFTITDTLDAGLIYNGDAVKTGPGSNPAPGISVPNDGTAAVAVTWNFGTVTNPAGNPQPIVITFTATVADVAGVTDTERLDNDVIAGWTDAGGPHTIIDPIDTDDVITVEVPALVVTKTVAPGIVVPGDVVTWTVEVANVGTGPAYGVDLSDTLPSAYFTYQPNSAYLDGGLIFNPVQTGLDLFWDLNRTVPGGSSFVLTFRTLVSPDTPEGAHTNVVTAVNGLDEEDNPIPPDNTDHVPGDTDPDDADDAEVLITLLEVSKSIADTTLSPNQVTTYTIRVNNPGGTPLTVTVTDTLPATFAYADNAAVDGSPREPDDNTPPGLVWNNLGPIAPGTGLTITFRITAATEVSGVYTNRVEVLADDGTNTITDTDTATTTLEAHPAIVVTKTRTTPSPVAQGSPVAFDLTIHNTGDTTLFTVPLTDTYNTAHLQFEQANPAETTVSNGVILWDDLTAIFGDFTPGMARTVALTFTARHVPGGVTSLNSVRVTGIDTNTTTVTDTDTATVTILSPRLHLVKQIAPTGAISPGDRLTYTLCYSNSGSLTATNVVITDAVPVNTTYVPGSVTTKTGTVEFTDGGGWGSTEPLTVTGLRWLVGNLPPSGETSCVRFEVDINMTISDTVSGMSVMAAEQGWVVLDGDTTGLEILGYTGAPTPTVTPTPMASPTPTASVTITPTPTAVITPTPTATPVPTPVVTVTPEITITITPTPSATPADTPTPAPTLEATATPTPTVGASPARPTETATPVIEPTAEPTATPIIESTPTAAPTPTATPEPSPTETVVDPPPVEPSDTPPPEPTATPEIEPTEETTTTTAAILPGFRPVPVAGKSYRVARPAVWAQPVFQAPITPTGTVSPAEPVPTETALPPAPATVDPLPTLEPTETALPTATATAIESTGTPVVESTATVQATSSLSPTPTGTSTPTLAPSPANTATPEATVTPVPTVAGLPTPTITATVPLTGTGPVLSAGYPIVGFETVMVNIVNAAFIDSNETPTQTDVVTTPLIRIVDPVFSKSADSSSARPGELVNYFIRVENPSPPSNANATNVSIVDALPSQLTLITYTVSSSPTTQVNATVTSGTMLIVGHPFGITQAVVSTVTLDIPVLEPGAQVRLDVTAEVNDVANPPPQTIQNVAVLNFAEGAPKDDDAPVDVPLPPSSGGDDDDALPLPTPTPTSTPLPGIEPTPTLPILFLPETGLREGQSGGMGVGWVLVSIALLGAGLVGLRRGFGGKEYPGRENEHCEN